MNKPTAFRILLFKNDIFGKRFYTFNSSDLNLLSNDVFLLINAHHDLNKFHFQAVLHYMFCGKTLSCTG